MSVTFKPRELFEEKLDGSPLGPPLAEVIGKEIPTRIAIPFTSDDSRILSGVWEADPGLSRWEFLERGEAIHVLEGRMVVTEDGGEPITVDAGTSAIFPIGWQGTWEIKERIRKFFVIFTA
ncbi:transcriptional regulator [Arthrobacter sp. ERGS1:01]|uniref:cupin domain-containing protein n=1 Tax=Arthrobacter sp. ERGS1:01 TaxID=1704044 RepID=UPI0006B50638|nr:cupin domain-containing protein [Arthrobacter sp. ERGS1:01]ALE06284.1 transcriptional regulator [Arthrobacter sp. ERGS1:01]